MRTTALQYQCQLRPSESCDTKIIEEWGAWVAQSVEHLTLDFNSGLDFTVQEIEPYIGLCADSGEPACDSLSPLSLPFPLSLSK